jgi:thiol:disulfide interchange protein DsbD
VKNGKINWAAFNPKEVDASLKRGQPVFMDYTAEWCANCKTNEKLFIETKAIHGVLESTQILPMKADFTKEDEVIEEWMDKLGRSGLPVYVVYYPDGSHDLLPEVITTEMLSTALNKASTKYPPGKFAPDQDGGTKTASATEPGGAG